MDYFCNKFNLNDNISFRFKHQVIIYNEYDNVLFNGSYLREEVKKWLKDNIGTKKIKWNYGNPAREHKIKARIKEGKLIRSIFYFTKKNDAVAFITRWK